MNEGIFYALAQAAMTLAGFSGFAAAFRLRGKHAWSPTELRVLWFLILDSFLVVLLSLLPLPLYIEGIDHEVIWALCSSLLGTWFIAGNFFALQGQRRERALKQLIEVPVITILFYGISVVAFIVGICLWLSAFDIFIPRGQAVYVGGLITLMAFAAIEFLFFIGQASAAEAKKL